MKKTVFAYWWQSAIWLTIGFFLLLVKFLFFSGIAIGIGTKLFIELFKGEDEDKNNNQGEEKEIMLKS